MLKPPPPRKKITPETILSRPVKAVPVVTVVKEGSDVRPAKVPSHQRRHKVKHGPRITVRRGKLYVEVPKRAPGRPKGDGRRCLCGCGAPCDMYFLRGHVNHFNRVLRDIYDGKVWPEEVLTPFLVEKLGPWKHDGDGLRPTHTYRDVYN